MLIICLVAFLPYCNVFENRMQEEGRKLDFSNVGKQLESVSQLRRKLIPPKPPVTSESIEKGKSISFQHLVGSNAEATTNSKVTSTQTSLNNSMTVRKKSFFLEKLRLKTSRNGIILYLFLFFV